MKPEAPYLQQEQAGDKTEGQVQQDLQQSIGAALLGHPLRHQAILLSTSLALQGLVQQARQVRQDLDVVRRLVTQLLPKLFRPHLVEHPALQKGLGGLPEIKVGVKLAT